MSNGITSRDRRELSLFADFLRRRHDRPHENVEAAFVEVYGRTVLDDLTPGLKLRVLSAPSMRVRGSQTVVFEASARTRSEFRSIVIEGLSVDELEIEEIKLGVYSYGPPVQPIPIAQPRPAEVVIDLRGMDIARTLEANSPARVYFRSKAATTALVEVFFFTVHQLEESP